MAQVIITDITKLENLETELLLNEDNNISNRITVGDIIRKGTYCIVTVRLKGSNGVWGIKNEQSGTESERHPVRVYFTGTREAEAISGARYMPFKDFRKMCANAHVAVVVKDGKQYCTLAESVKVVKEPDYEKPFRSVERGQYECEKA